MQFSRIALVLTCLSLVETLPVGLAAFAKIRHVAPPNLGACPAVSTDEDCPRILYEGLPCAECLEATGKNLTLTPDTDPLWYPNPNLPATSNKTSPFSLPCRWALRYYLHAIDPEPPFKCTMLGMCTTLFEFGPTAIRCLEEEYPMIAYQVFGQFARCNFARDMLGEEWGGEKAEKSAFTNTRTNRSLSAIEFVREGFLPLALESSSTKV